MTEEGAQIRLWLEGDEAAALLIEKLFAVSQIADDFVDQDKPIDRNAAMCKLLHAALVEIPSNPAYSKYQAWILPLLSSSIVMWCMSNELALDPEEDCQRFAWAMRDIAEQLIHQIALVKNGLSYAHKVAIDVARYYRTNDDKENFEEWGKTL